MIHYNDKFLRHLELELRDILVPNDFVAFGKNLLELRQDYLNEQALAHQKKLLPDIIAFNDALYIALQKMYDHAHELYSKISAFQPKIELKAQCFLSINYPSLHPFQRKDRQELWEILCDTDWNPLYDSGVTFPLVLPHDIDMSFDEFIGMKSDLPNWNERLDQVLTKDLHLINAFHNLFDHTNFALTDFIFCRDFDLEYSINYTEKATHKNEQL